MGFIFCRSQVIVELAGFDRFFEVDSMAFCCVVLPECNTPLASFEVCWVAVTELGRAGSKRIPQLGLCVFEATLSL